MDYRALAEELIAQTAPMMCHPRQKKLSEAARGEAYVLQYLLPRTEVPSGEIAERMHVSSARMAALLNVMAEKGLVRRLPDAHDHRKTLVEITAQGREAAAVQREFVLGRMEEMLSQLGEHDAREFVRIIAKIRESYLPE